MGEIADQGLSVRAMFHPIVEVQRDRAGAARRRRRRRAAESMIQVFLEDIGRDREQALVEGVKATLADVRAAVDDFPAMLELMGRTVAELDGLRQGARRRRSTSCSWLQRRALRVPRRADLRVSAPEERRVRAGGAALPGQGRPGRAARPRAHGPAPRQRAGGADAPGQGPHRPRPGASPSPSPTSRAASTGAATWITSASSATATTAGPRGEVRFVGLFTAEAYDQPAGAVPLIREKVARVLARAGAAPGSYNEKRLKNIVENHPARRALPDQRGRAAGAWRWASCTSTTGRGCGCSSGATRSTASPRCCCSCRATATIPTCASGPARSWPRPTAGGSRPTIRASTTRRWRGCTTSSASRRASTASPTCARLEAEIAEAARTWEDRFDAAVRASGRDPDAVAETLARYREAFPAGYRDRFDAAEALADVAVIEAFGRGAADLRARLPHAGATARCTSASSSTARTRRRRWPTCCRSSRTWA